MFVRTSYEYFTDRVDKYFKALLAQVSHLQFYTQNGSKGGPIVMVQVITDRWSTGFLKDNNFKVGTGDPINVLNLNSDGQPSLINFSIVSLVVVSCSQFCCLSNITVLYQT